MLIAVDHGNKQIKTVNCAPFTSGLRESATRPLGDMVIYYGGKYYSLMDERIPYRRDKLSNEFGQVVRRSGLPHNRFHDLRHAAATNMHQLTGDYYTVSEILGHTLEGTAKSLGFTAQVNTVTARYVEVRRERKLAVLKLYHETVLLPAEVSENPDPNSP